jgi:hypothetical protein
MDWLTALIDTPLYQELESKERKLRHKATRKLLQERLQRLVEATGDSNSKLLLDDTYITCAEYQLFVDHMREKEGRDYQPDHWTTYTFDSGESLKPIVGIRGQDALQFCNLLNWLYPNDKIRYVLPHPLLIEDRQDSNIGYFSYDGYDFRLLGLDPAAAQAIWQQLGTFLHAELPDFAFEFAKQDRNSIIDYHINDNPDPLSFRYISDTQHFNRTHLRLLRLPLKFVLGLHYGRDLAIATDYDTAHLSDITWSCHRSRQRSSVTIDTKQLKRYVLDEFRLAGFVEVTTAVEANRIAQAWEAIDKLAHSQDIYEARWSFILSDYLKSFLASNDRELRQAERYYLAHIALCAFTGYTLLKAPHTHDHNFSWNRMSQEDLKNLENTSVGYDKLLLLNLEDPPILEQRIFSAIYWQMLVLLAREAGQLVAWEGIRIAAEKL